MPNSKNKHTVFFDNYQMKIKAVDDVVLIPPLITYDFEGDVKQIIKIVETLY